jgi:hypothetical protein
MFITTPGAYRLGRWCITIPLVVVPFRLVWLIGTGIITRVSGCGEAALALTILAPTKCLIRVIPRDDRLFDIISKSINPSLKCVLHIIYAEVEDYGVVVHLIVGGTALPDVIN